MRGLALGAQYAILGLGGLLNNLMGGAIIKANLVDGWRYNLYISAAFQLLGTIMLLAFYRPLYLDIEEPPYLQRIKSRIDWVGNVLWICAFISLMFGLISGGNLYPWDSAAVIASLCVGFGLGLVLAAHQLWIKKDGIFQSVFNSDMIFHLNLSHSLFEHRNFALSILAIFIEGVVYVTLNIWSPQQVSKRIQPGTWKLSCAQTGTLYTSDPVLLGLHFTVLLIFASLIALAAGWYSKRFRRVKEILVAGYLVSPSCVYLATKMFIKIIACGLVGFALCKPGSEYDGE